MSTYYEKRISADGTVSYRPESTAGSEYFKGDPISQLPPGATAVRLASRVGRPHTYEAGKAQVNFIDIGGSKSKYFMSVDFRPSTINHAQWIRFGNSKISKWCSDQADGTNKFSDLPEFRKFDYSVEGGVLANPSGGPRLAGHYFYTATATQLEAAFMNNIPRYGAGAHWMANIEESNYWIWDYYDNPSPNYPPWDAVKTQKIKCYSDGVERTLEQLRADVGRRTAEQNVRRSIGFALFLQVAGRGGAYAAFGSSAWQGEPRTNCLTYINRFLDDASIDVRYVEGYTGVPGKVTFSGVTNGQAYSRTYENMTGSFYKFETFHLDYHYYFSYEYLGSNFNAEPDYPTLYANSKNIHPFAREVGHWMANRIRLQDVHGGKLIPSVRMHELEYEGDGSYKERTPAGFGLKPNAWGDGGNPKIYVIPYVIRIMRMAHHFLEGETEGSGFHIFHAEGAPNQGIVYSFTQEKYNLHLHTVSALYAAARDMETILDKIVDTTLTCDIDIKIGNTGSFQSVNGATAYAFGPDGSRGTMLPCAITRHKTTSEGLYVIFMMAMDQPWGTTRTDVIRIPGVGNGNTIKCTYKGPDLQVFEVLFPSGVSNTEFTAQSIIPAWTKPGYGGIVNS
ncbi:hypothetical protein [Spirosoma aerolatum]|uniref:hypothetical protein n=1 Tax=Spirosoma aerolatum TaxID=1211326 RepID=UPI0009ABB307|nr:hypothetical protein [Spirosoma aerolatum]